MTHPFCTITASTKRNPAAVGGKIGAPVTYLASLAVTPLWPVGQSTIKQLELNSPREFKECFHVPDGDTMPDVKEGDVLVHGSASYRVFWVGEWYDLGGGIPTLHMVVQEIKGT